MDRRKTFWTMLTPLGQIMAIIVGVLTIFVALRQGVLWYGDSAVNAYKLDTTIQVHTGDIKEMKDQLGKVDKKVDRLLRLHGLNPESKDEKEPEGIANNK